MAPAPSGAAAFIDGHTRAGYRETLQPTLLVAADVTG
jgi:hypothetical protein